MLTIIRYRLLIAMIMSPLTTLTQGNIAQCFPEATLAELFMKPLGGSLQSLRPWLLVSMIWFPYQGPKWPYSPVSRFETTKKALRLTIINPIFLADKKKIGPGSVWQCLCRVRPSAMIKGGLRQVLRIACGGASGERGPPRKCGLVAVRGSDAMLSIAQLSVEWCEEKLELWVFLVFHRANSWTAHTFLEDIWGHLGCLK